MKQLYFTYCLWWLFILPNFSQADLILTPSQAKSDLQLLKLALFEVHPGLNRYNDETSLKKELIRLESNLKQPISSFNFYKNLSKIVAQFNCGHSVIKPGKTWTERMLKQGLFLPLSLFAIDSSLFVRANGSTDQRIIQGTQILSINGRSASKIIREIFDHLPSDGTNRTSKSYLLNRDIFTFNSYFYLWVDRSPSFEITALRPEEKEPIHFIIKAINPGTFRYQLQQNTAPPYGESIHWETRPQEKISFRTIDSISTAILTIKKFDNRKAQSSFLKNTFRVIRKKQTQNLILDLRGNPGGLDEIGRLLFTYFIKKPTPYIKSIQSKTNNIPLELKSQSTDWNTFLDDLNKKVTRVEETSNNLFFLKDRYSKAMGVQPPNKKGFEGNLYVLVDGGTDSAAATLAHLIYFNNLGLLIGEKSGAAYQGGHSFTFLRLLLPNSQFYLQIPIMKYQLSVHPEQFKMDGAIPHIPIKNKFNDYLQDRNKSMEKAISLIIEKQAKQ